MTDAQHRLILDRLEQGPAKIGDLCELLGCSQPQARALLRALRDAGLVVLRDRTRAATYALADTSGPALHEIKQG